MAMWQAPVLSRVLLYTLVMQNTLDVVKIQNYVLVFLLVHSRFFFCLDGNWLLIYIFICLSECSIFDSLKQAEVAGFSWITSAEVLLNSVGVPDVEVCRVGAFCFQGYFWTCFPYFMRTELLFWGHFTSSCCKSVKQETLGIERQKGMLVRV